MDLKKVRTNWAETISSIVQRTESHLQKIQSKPGNYRIEEFSRPSTAYRNITNFEERPSTAVRPSSAVESKSESLQLKFEVSKIQQTFEKQIEEKNSNYQKEFDLLMNKIAALEAKSSSVDEIYKKLDDKCIERQVQFSEVLNKVQANFPCYITKEDLRVKEEAIRNTHIKQIDRLEVMTRNALDENKEFQREMSRDIKNQLKTGLEQAATRSELEDLKITLESTLMSKVEKRLYAIENYEKITKEDLYNLKAEIRSENIEKYDTRLNTLERREYITQKHLNDIKDSIRQEMQERFELRMNSLEGKDLLTYSDLNKLREDITTQTMNRLEENYNNLDRRIKSLKEEHRDSTQSRYDQIQQDFDRKLRDITNTVSSIQSNLSHFSEIDMLKDRVSKQDQLISQLVKRIDELSRSANQSRAQFYQEALATFGRSDDISAERLVKPKNHSRQDSLNPQENPSSPELVMVSLSDIGESDSESIGFSPNPSPLNQLMTQNQQIANLVNSSKKFVFEQGEPIKEESREEDTTPEHSYVNSQSNDESSRTPQRLNESKESDHKYDRIEEEKKEIKKFKPKKEEKKPIIPNFNAALGKVFGISKNSQPLPTDYTPQVSALKLDSDRSDLSSNSQTGEKPTWGHNLSLSTFGKPEIPRSDRSPGDELFQAKDSEWQPTDELEFFDNTYQQTFQPKVESPTRNRAMSKHFEFKPTSLTESVQSFTVSTEKGHWEKNIIGKSGVSTDWETGVSPIKKEKMQSTSESEGLLNSRAWKPPESSESSDVDFSDEDSDLPLPA